jgi:tight adherence protein C
MIDKHQMGTKLPTEGAKQLGLAKLLSWLNPVFLVSQFIIDKLRLTEPLRRRLGAAHIKLAPREFFSLEVAFMLCLFVLTRTSFIKMDYSKGAILSLFLGFVLPEFWLRRKIAARKAAIARVLPETVDLIELCIEAGLDFTMAIKWVINKAHPNPLIEELAVVLEEIKWGKPRTEALRDMSRRLNVPEVNSFVRTIVHAERMGTPVAEAFAVLSEDMRLQRFRIGERFALKAPIKILFPLIFFILPVIGIIIIGPVFLQFVGSKSILGNF